MAATQEMGPRPRPRAVVPQRQLRDAIAAGDLELHYQPIIDLTTGSITSFEALLRLRSDTGALLFPDDFLPAVAHTPVMHDVTAWVVSQACAQAAAFAPVGVAINVAAIDVVRPTLVDLVAAEVERFGIPPELITIELTEHAAVQGMETAVRVLEQLRELGVHVSLDDFGTGYSSLLYLRDLPLTQVKIDRTFVAGIGRTEDDGAIVRSVIQLAHRVGLVVVAEGVEVAEQLRFLRNAHCDRAQGYLLAMPAPADEVPTGIDAALLAGASRPRRKNARVRAALPIDVRDHLRELAAQGASLHTIAAVLNREGHPTAAGTRWTAATVARAMPDV
jgi:EAL domain-containing protein (putative c-di-GMP-specific phosphodiesterase class I)